MAQTTLDEAPLELKDLAAHLASGCKPASQFRVGAVY